MISQMTPAGYSPASRARSTAASVCPARSSTPPGLGAAAGRRARAREVLGVGVGVDRSQDGRGAVRGRDAGRDLALRADRDVEGGLLLRGVLVRHRRDAQLVEALAVIGMQMRPRPCVAMKLTASGVDLLGRHDEVALVLAILVVDDDDHPTSRMSSSASSMVKNGGCVACARHDDHRPPRTRGACRRDPRRPAWGDSSSDAHVERDEALDVLRHHVDLDVDRCADRACRRASSTCSVCGTTAPRRSSSRGRRRSAISRRSRWSPSGPRSP